MSSHEHPGERETAPLEAISVATPPGLPAIDGHGRPVLPGFVIQERLGEGRMSVVWKGVIAGGFRPVAIKVLRAELMSDPEVVRSFVSEGRLLAELEADNGEHPHLVPVLDAGTFGHHLCLLMKYMRFGDLGHWVNDHCPGGIVDDPRQFLDIAVQVTEGAAYLHDCGLIHRDIKPANVFVDRHGGRTVFRLGDLGLAVGGWGADAQGDAATGTPLYMAPEAFQREQATPATDVYALGSTFFHLLTGHPPFRSATLVGLSTLVRSAPAPQAYRQNPRVPKNISDIIGICLRKDPTRRFIDARALLRTLKTCQAEFRLDSEPHHDRSDDSTWLGEPV